MVAVTARTILITQLCSLLVQVEAFLNSGQVPTAGLQDPLYDQISHRLTTLEDRLRDKDTQITTLQSQVASQQTQIMSMQSHIASVQNTIPKVMLKSCIT